MFASGGVSGLIEVTSAFRSSALVEAVDIAPTLLDAAGLASAPDMEGRSLWPLLTGGTDLDRHRSSVYSEYHNASAMMQDLNWTSSMVRTTQYKLVAVHGLEAGELYDLREDPGEAHNRWDDANYLSVKASMLKLLCDRMD